MDDEISQKPEEKKGKEAIADTIGGVSYPLVVGSIIDYSSGLRGMGIVASRGYATAINAPTGAIYGKWRNFLYKATRTTDESSKLRKGAVELAAFNTFHTPLYATVVAVGSLYSHLLKGEVGVDLEKVAVGTRNLAMFSPFIGPTMGWWCEGVRRLFGLKSSGRKAREKLEQEVQK